MFFQHIDESKVQHSKIQAQAPQNKLFSHKSLKHDNMEKKYIQ